MKLSHLVRQANNIYQLHLTDEERRELHRRLISAGFESQIRPAETRDLLDAILQTTDHLRARPRMATATTRLYSGMKKEAIAGQHDGCPRCQQTMQSVLLAAERQADYCQACAITLPVKV